MCPSDSFRCARRFRVVRWLAADIGKKVQMGLNVERYNVNDHRAAAIDMQAEKATRPAAPCASYCYRAVSWPARQCVPITGLGHSKISSTSRGFCHLRVSNHSSTARSNRDHVVIQGIEQRSGTVRLNSSN